MDNTTPDIRFSSNYRTKSSGNDHRSGRSAIPLAIHSIRIQRELSFCPSPRMRYLVHPIPYHYALYFPARPLWYRRHHIALLARSMDPGSTHNTLEKCLVPVGCLPSMVQAFWSTTPPSLQSTPEILRLNMNTIRPDSYSWFTRISDGGWGSIGLLHCSQANAPRGVLHLCSRFLHQVQ